MAATMYDNDARCDGQIGAVILVSTFLIGVGVLVFLASILWPSLDEVPPGLSEPGDAPVVGQPLVSGESMHGNRGEIEAVVSSLGIEVVDGWCLVVNPPEAPWEGDCG